VKLKITPGNTKFLADRFDDFVLFQNDVEKRFCKFIPKSFVDITSSKQQSIQSIETA